MNISRVVVDPGAGQTVFNWDSDVSATFNTGNRELLNKYLAIIYRISV